MENVPFSAAPPQAGRLAGRMSTTTQDSALRALLLPYLQGHLVWPGHGLFLRARAGSALTPETLPGLICQQSFKPEADALLRAGFELGALDPTRRYPCVLLLAPRQRAEARALLARAVTLTEPGGRVLLSAANTAGARSHQADLERLVGPVTSLSKHKCRVCWSGPLENVDAALLTQWQALDAVQPIDEGRFLSRPGLFAWDRIDAGSSLLAQHLPPTLRGAAADLGAGVGYLSASLMTSSRGIVSLDVFEAEERALELARVNLASFASRVELRFHWHDVTAGLLTGYDVIISNPPFHDAADTQPELGRRFIDAAMNALLPGGSLWVVAHRHLGYQELLLSRFAAARVVVEQQGYQVLTASRSGTRRDRTSR